MSYMFNILSEKDNDTCRLYTFEELAALLARKKYLKIERKNLSNMTRDFPKHVSTEAMCY